MKRIKLILSLAIFVILPLALISCNAKVTVEEIEAALPTLVDESRALNEIYFGNGFKIDAERSDVERDGGYFVCDKGSLNISSVSDLKTATEKVFTREYAEVLYSSAFSSADGARFKDGDGVLMQKAMDLGYFIPLRVYDYSSVEIEKSKGNRTTVLVKASANGDDFETVTLVIVRSGNRGNYSYRLDGPTY